MKKIIFFVTIILVIVILSTNYVLRNFETWKQKSTMESLLKSYYNTNNNSDVINTVMDSSAFDALYQKEYKDFITKEGFDRLVLKRMILGPAKIAQYFNCTIQLTNIKFSKIGEHSYAYKAYLKVKSANLESKEIVNTGAIGFNDDKDQEKVSHIIIDPLYEKVSKLFSDI